MVAVNNLSVEFASKPLFNDISLTINVKEKLALVGKNGAGKSTLLKIIAGLQLPTAGTVSLPNDFKIGYLPQEMPFVDDSTLIEEAKKAFSERIELERKITQMQEELVNRTDYHSDSYLSLIEKIDELTQTLNNRFEANMEGDVEKTLIGLGFKPSDFNRHTSEFSGGWRMRVELAKILLQKPDLLLLDEPTNHLDINSIQWLEQFLINKASAVLLVSHDKAFLDNVTNRTIEISCGKIYDYKVSYTPFINLRLERIEQQTKAYLNQQKYINETKDFIERFRYKATKAVQVQSRIKQLEKIIPIEIDEIDNHHVKFNFPPAERSGDFPLIIDSLSKSYGDHNVFSNAALTLRRGEKIALVGSNGEGKTTMVKCIMGETEYNGSLKLGHNVKIGYFAQNQAQKLDQSKTVFQTLDDIASGEIRTRLKDLLATFLFRGEDIDKKVSVLSGGEKTRLALAKLLLEPVNFLILDEPTNHLDIHTKEVLKNALNNFTGTLIVVSHDREFLEGLVNKVYEFANGSVRENIGGIREFLKTRNIQQKDGEHIAETIPDKATAPKSDVPFAIKKEQDRNLRRIEKKIATKEELMLDIENNIKIIEDSISQQSDNPEIYKEYADLKEKLNSVTEDWENAVNELEDLKKQYGRQ
ncbi:MAG: ABC-F family ATP-binding cassette domain-containing protein [Muribaculaceae bacterium]|nr:ABC-F family ATP-binding cassette domain-containing protein [Muribaculaceae bacterium]